MKLRIVVAAAAVFATTFLGTTNQSLASNYPPDYPMHTDCQKISDTIEVCRKLGSGWASIYIEYSGPIISRAMSQQGMSVWVKLNGHEGFFNMDLYPGNNTRDRATVLLSNARYHCSMNPRTGSYWDCKQPTPEMKHLLFWAKPDRGGTMAANAWDVELAFNLNNTRVWDNNGGPDKNYRVHFEPYGYGHY